MDRSFIIQKGDTAKYELSIVHEDFDMHDDEFSVIVRWGLKGESLVIPKTSMIEDEDGKWFVLFGTQGMTGKVTAETHYMVDDSDVEGEEREEVDYQVIGFVTDSACPRFEGCLKCEGEGSEYVTWRRVWRSDVNSVYQVLCTNANEPITDSEGNVFRVRKENN